LAIVPLGDNFENRRPLTLLQSSILVWSARPFESPASPAAALRVTAGSHNKLCFSASGGFSLRVFSFSWLTSRARDE
jgi:hypothetical protein